MTPDAVVFDIGGMLIDWQPHLVWPECCKAHPEVSEVCAKTMLSGQVGGNKPSTQIDALRTDLSARSLL